ncbi:MAG: hypothetical protein CMG00_03170 [Candidatus Marinimicrobia bacterium]|nr:hypothetical protein [Candidatus Neomarinimicrobiota bacterium]
MKIKTKIFKTILSTTLLSMILFLACDERTPVSSPPPVLSYQLEFFVDNNQCDSSAEDATCSETTAYAAENSANLGELSITFRLQYDSNEDGIIDGGYGNQEVQFSALKDDGSPAYGLFLIDGQTEDVTSGTTNTNGLIQGKWLDKSDTGNFILTASYIDQFNEPFTKTQNLSLISPDALVGSISTGTDSEYSPGNTLNVPDNGEYFTYIQATVKDSENNALPNIDVKFQLLGDDQPGSLVNNTATTGSDGTAEVRYQLSNEQISDTAIQFKASVDNAPETCSSSCESTITLNLTSEFFPQEYYVKQFSFTSDLTNDYNGNNINDLTLISQLDNQSEDDGEETDNGESNAPEQDSEFIVTFTATATDIDGAYVDGVPVQFRKTSVFGAISTSLATTVNGQATTTITVTEAMLTSGFANFSIEAIIYDPQLDEVGNAIPITLADGNQALKTLEAEFFTEQYALISDIQTLQISKSQIVNIQDNNTFNYETTITAKTINSAGALVTDPVMIKFEKAYTCNDGTYCTLNGNSCSDGSQCSTTSGGYLSSSSVMTNENGEASSVFTVNSDEFSITGATDIDFKISLEENSNVFKELKLSYFIAGSSAPELNVSEFHFYPDVDTINHSLYETTNLSVIAKNSAGVGVANALVRFELSKSRDSFGIINTPSEYTCCGDQGSESNPSEETYVCSDGSNCDPDGDACVDGSQCTASSSVGPTSNNEGGLNGLATINYENITEGIDQLRAYILDPNNASVTLWEDIIKINSIPNCPDCKEQLKLVAKYNELPETITGFSLEYTDIYAFYTDSLGNPAQVDDFITFEAIQKNDDDDWLDVGSISPQTAFFEQGSLSAVQAYLPDEFEIAGSSIVYAGATFNMENSAGLGQIVGTYKGLKDTLGVFMRSTEASYVEILPPSPSEIIVQGGGGQEATLLTVNVTDGNGNRVSDPHYVKFEITPPLLDGVHLNGLPGDTNETEVSSDGVASVTLNSGTKPGTVHIRVTVTDFPTNPNFDPNLEIIAEATPVTITTGPPTSAVIGYAFGEAINIGGGLTEMPISIMLWDAWANPVTDSTAAYFTLNPPTSAAIIAEAKTGNIKPNGGADESWPGIAWTTTQYNSAQLFEFPEILATTTGNTCIDANLTSREACENVDNVWLPLTSETDGLCSRPTGTNPEICDPEDYACDNSNNNLVDDDFDNFIDEGDECTTGTCCESLSASGFGNDPDGDNVYWGVALPITFSSETNIVSYENVCVDCSLSLVPLSDTQYDFNDAFPISTNNTYEVEFRAQLLDFYQVPVEGALVELIITGSQGGPTIEAGGCSDNQIVNQAECEAEGETWGYQQWVNELPTYGQIAVQTDADGLKYFKITFTGDECVRTAVNPEQWNCTSPSIQANLLNPNGATSQQVSITINNTVTTQ